MTMIGENGQKIIVLLKNDKIFTAFSSSSEPKLLLLNQHIKRDFGYYKSSQNDKSIR